MRLFLIAGFIFFSYLLLTIKQDSAFGRLYIWKIAITILNCKNIVFGVGYNCFGPAYMNSQEIFFRKNPDSNYCNYADNITYCFNDVIQTIIENGVIGIIIIIMIAVSLYTSYNRENKNMVMTLKCFFLNFFIFSLFSYPLSVLPIKILLVTCMAFLASLNENHVIIISFPNNFIANICRNISIIVLTIIAIIITICYINALSNYGKASFLSNDHRQRESIPFYEKASNFFCGNGVFMSNYGKALSLSMQYEKSTAVLCKASNFTLNTFTYTTLGYNCEAKCDFKSAENYYWKAHWMVPKKEYPLYLLAKLYYKKGDDENFKKTADFLLGSSHHNNSAASKQIREDLYKITK